VPEREEPDLLHTPCNTQDGPDFRRDRRPYVISRCRCRRKHLSARARRRRRRSGPGGGRGEARSPGRRRPRREPPDRPRHGHRRDPAIASRRRQASDFAESRTFAWTALTPSCRRADDDAASGPLPGSCPRYLHSGSRS
jgi:hypothetical protein